MLVAEEGGKTVEYYLTKNDVAEKGRSSPTFSQLGSSRTRRWARASLSARPCSSGTETITVAGSFVMSSSFTNQVLAQLELQANAEKYGKTVTMLPKKLDEEVALEMVRGFGGVVTQLTKQQADYIGVTVEVGAGATRAGQIVVHDGRLPHRIADPRS